MGLPTGVCLQEWSVCLWGGGGLPPSGVYLQGGVLPMGSLPPEGWAESLLPNHKKWALRVLLECFIVYEDAMHLFISFLLVWLYFCVIWTIPTTSDWLLFMTQK